MKRHLTTICTLSLALAAALAFYLVSFHVAQERLEIAALQGSIARDADDMRALQAEYGKRARLPQLEHWNGELASVSATSSAMDAPAPAQMLGGLAQLANYRPGAVAAPTRVEAVARDAVVPPARAPIYVADAVDTPILPGTGRGIDRKAVGGGDRARPTPPPRFARSPSPFQGGSARAETAAVIAARAPAAPDDSLADLTQAIGSELKEARRPTLQKVSLR